MKKSVIYVLFICVFLAFASLLSGCSSCSPEEGEEVQFSEGLEFTLKENLTYDLAGLGSFEGTTLKIPNSYKGLPVTSIGETITAQTPTYSGIKKLIIPSSITYIYKFNAPDLTEVLFEGKSHLQKIGYEAFTSCRNLITFNFPASLKAIEANAFRGCRLSCVSLPNNIEYIGQDAFDYDLYKEYNGAYYLGNEGKPYLVLCEIESKNITSFSLPNETRVICDGVFEGCENLISFSMSNNVVTISYGAFSGCKNLTDITLSENLISIGDFAFYECGLLENVTLYRSLISIGGDAFSNCSNLKSITIPTSVQEIGSNAFSGCTALKEAIFQNSLKIINSGMFSGCSNLEKFTVPDGVITIGDFAFSNCSRLKEITLPSSITFNGADGRSFGYCENLEKVYFNGTIEQWAAMDFYDKADNPLRFGADLYIDNSLVEDIVITETSRINGYVFYGCDQLKSVIIGGNVRDIGRYAFYGCTEITTLQLLEGVEGVDAHAFEDCSKLANIDLPNSIRGLHRDAFSSGMIVTDDAVYVDGLLLRGMKSTVNILDGTVGIADSAFEEGAITEITIPSSVKYIGSSAFKNCSSLETVTFEETSELIYLGKNAFEGCAKLEKITIPSGVQELRYGTFAKCTKLSSIVFPTNMKKIEGSAFNDCSSLESLIFPESVEEIVELPNSCAALAEIILPNNLKNFTPDHYYVGNDSLQYNEYDNAYYLGSVDNPYLVLIKAKSPNIVSCTIHERTQWVFPYAFENCDQLQNLTVFDAAADSVGDMCILLKDYLNSLQYNVYDGACYLGNEGNPYLILVEVLNKDIESYAIHENTLTIGSDAFYGCGLLKSINIPTSVHTLAHNALRGCWSLNEIVIPESVYYIGDTAFAECFSLQKIVIPDSVEYLGDQVFYESKSAINIFLEKESVPNTYYESSFVYWDTQSWMETLVIRRELKHNIFLYSEDVPDSSGDYWHYVNGVPTPW